MFLNVIDPFGRPERSAPFLCIKPHLNSTNQPQMVPSAWVFPLQSSLSPTMLLMFSNDSRQKKFSNLKEECVNSNFTLDSDHWNNQ